MNTQQAYIQGFMTKLAERQIDFSTFYRAAMQSGNVELVKVANITHRLSQLSPDQVMHYGKTRALGLTESANEWLNHVTQNMEVEIPIEESYLNSLRNQRDALVTGTDMPDMYADALRRQRIESVGGSDVADLNLRFLPNSSAINDTELEWQRALRESKVEGGNVGRQPGLADRIAANPGVAASSLAPLAGLTAVGAYGMGDADTPGNKIRQTANKNLGTDFKTQSRFSNTFGG